jgi:predicted Holliday junction resolvase-like endonuclease
MVTLAVIAGVAVVVEGGVLVNLYNQHSMQRAVEESAAREQASREQIERERLAQEEAAREAALQKADEELKARQEAAAKAARERGDQAAQESKRRSDAAAALGLSLEWQDHAIRYVGTLTTEGGAAKMTATLFDLRTGARIGSYTIPMHTGVSKERRNESKWS